MIMFKRIISISKKRSFFLFGARATGKSTLIEMLFSKEEAFFISLLDPRILEKLEAYPSELEALVRPAILDNKIVVIDEIQKVPALLDLIHKLIQKEKAIFALTGSSARKLKRGCANLLAGRASVYYLFPLLFNELGDKFYLKDALEWGTLPELFSLDEDDEKLRFLQAYTDTYIQEEIIAEQIVRKLPPFRRFLQIAAQMNGKVINASAMAADINTDYSNVRNYFEILEDTLLGFKLDSYHSSIRKRQRVASKFYWIDMGIVRSLQKTLGIKLSPSTSVYGDAFEAFIITQIKAGLEYQVGQYQISYLMTKDGAEIDLIVERAGKETLCIEIKSGDSVNDGQLRNLVNLSNDINNAKAICLYGGKDRLNYDSVEVWPWQDALINFELVPR